MPRNRKIIILVLLLFSLPLILSAKSPKIISTGKIHPNMAAPRPFEYRIDYKADSSPLTIGQSLSLIPLDKKWTGKYVNIYYSECCDDSTWTLLYQHKLPTNGKVIGKVPIVDGDWCFKWKVPKTKDLTQNRGCYLIAKSDDGIVSGTTINILPYDNLKVTVRVDYEKQKVFFSGAGFPKDCCVTARLITQDPTVACEKSFEDIVSFHKIDGTFSYDFSTGETYFRHAITPGAYDLLILIFTKKTHDFSAQYAVDNYFTIKDNTPNTTTNP